MLRGIALLLATAFFVACAVPLVMMLGAVRTPEGHAFAFGCAAFAAFPLQALLRRGVARANLVMGIVLLGFAAVRAPTGEGLPGSGLSSHHLPHRSYARWSPANVIPEVDQIRMEHTTFRPVIQRVFGDLYIGCMTYQVPVQEEIDARPEWRALGSSGMHEGWSEVLAKLAHAPSPEPAHWYQYVPPHAPGEKLPVLVFFHGFGCNAKSDLWCWKPIADRGRFALVHPSMGFGMMDTRASGIEPFLQEWRADPDLDWSRAYVGGLSNGALRAALAAGEHPELFRGVVLLAPIAQALAACAMPRPMQFTRYPPVLVMRGSEDRAVDPVYVKQRRTELAARGVPLTEHIYEGIDHYANFRARDRYEQDVLAWMGEVSARGASGK